MSKDTIYVNIFCCLYGDDVNLSSDILMALLSQIQTVVFNIILCLLVVVCI
jgi:hypothetical protein